jgi:flagellar hook-associated protein FlgK
MASLNQAWNIATSSLAADQAAISVVAGNIANANTPGYTTETVQWGAIDTVTVGGRSSAGGVSLQGVDSQRDRVLNQRIDQQTQDQSSTAARLAALNDLESLFSGAITATGSATSSGVADIGQQMTAFFQSFSSLSADPSNASLRTGVISAAQNLAATFNQVSSSLEQQSSGLNASIASGADQVNSLTTDIASLNAKISASSPTGDAGTLEDQRQYDIQQLSQLVGIHQITNENNSLTITTTSGAVLVAGGQSVDLQTQSTDGVTHLLLGGVDQTSALTNGGGQIGGTLQARGFRYSERPCLARSVGMERGHCREHAAGKRSGRQWKQRCRDLLFGRRRQRSSERHLCHADRSERGGCISFWRRSAGRIERYRDRGAGLGSDRGGSNAGGVLCGAGGRGRREGERSNHDAGISERLAYAAPVTAERLVVG